MVPNAPKGSCVCAHRCAVTFASLRVPFAKSVERAEVTIVRFPTSSGHIDRSNARTL